MRTPTPLPLDSILPDVLARLEQGPALVLEAPPGTGKTTRVPRALLQAKFREDREILVLEPRRLAAKMAARRVAEELGEEVGRTVGYQFRFENVGGPETRVRFLTEGMFLRRLLSDPLLHSVAAVVVDEFHERHLQGDVALGAVRRLQLGERPDLRVIVMSATLDAEKVATYLGHAPRLRVEGRMFPVTIEYASDGTRRLEDAVARAAERVITEHEGDVLVFLPGQAEIRRAGDALVGLARREKLSVVPLYGDLTREEQDRAVLPGPERKIILSTNVAETSLTIEGVRIVIDSGLARRASFSHGAGLPALRTRPISKASAIQRAGRAGRTAPGVCLRLYSKHDFEGRASYETPEVSRTDLSQTVLELKTLGVTDLAGFEWFEAPEPSALVAATRLLTRIGALSGSGAITPLGRRLAELPAHPRLGRLAIEGERVGIAERASRLAAFIGEGRPGVGGPLDLIEQFERDQPTHAARRAAELLMRHLKPVSRTQTDTSVDRNDALRRAVLTAYPDRIAKRRATTLVLAAGGSVELTASEVATLGDATYFVAVDIEEQSHQPGRPASRRVRSLCPIEPEWLFDLGVEERTLTEWDAERERVQCVTQIVYDGIVLDESSADADPEAVAQCLASAVVARGIGQFVSEEKLNEFFSRVRFAREQAPLPSLPDYSDGQSAIHAALTPLCIGRRSFAELRNIDLIDELLASLPPEHRAPLDRLAPEFVTLHAGRRARVHYETGKPPWIESRLQDFFGMRTGPTVLNGRVPLTLHLLAPNQRAVQVTSDLAGFWTRVYPELRRELGRRYPRHKWPEDPLS